MKTLTVLAFLFSMTAHAGETISCINPEEPNLTYTLNSTDYENYDFKVKRLTLVHNSCRTRWGCDYEEKVIFFDKLVMTDYQGSSVYESKRTYILMEDMDEVSYTYTVKGANGKFETRSTTLKCK